MAIRAKSSPRRRHPESCFLNRTVENSWDFIAGPAEQESGADWGTVESHPLKSSAFTEHFVAAGSRHPRRGGVGHNPFAACVPHVNERSFTAQSTQVFGVEECLGKLTIEGDTREGKCSVGRGGGEGWSLDSRAARRVQHIRLASFRTPRRASRSTS